MTVHSASTALGHPIDPVTPDRPCFSCGQPLINQPPLVLWFGVETATGGMWLHAQCSVRLAHKLLRDGILALDRQSSSP